VGVTLGVLVIEEELEVVADADEDGEAEGEVVEEAEALEDFDPDDEELLEADAE